jgi:soluble lytic murein transglycosylase
LSLAASAAVNLGETARAEQLFSRLAATSTGESQAEAYLWVGRLALQRGDSNTAQATLRLAVETLPDSYYSARAQDLENNRAPFAKPARYRFQFDDLVELNAAEEWLRTSFGFEQAGALWPLSAALEADPRLIRGQELWAVAAYDDADEEFDDLVELYGGDGLASYQLAIHLRSIAAFRASVFAAANVIRTAGVSTLEAPPYIARMRYPIYYLDVVMDVSQRWELDPLLVFSLIRLESLFNTNAIVGTPR